MGNPGDYTFHWRAQLTDGTVLKQFRSDGTETPFSEVQLNEEYLINFWLELQDGPSTFNIGVNLVDGSFNINEFVILPLKDDKPWKNYNPDFRLINFRRIREHFFINGKVNGVDMDYFLGWQVTHEGKNYKKLLCLDSEGNWWMS